MPELDKKSPVCPDCLACGFPFWEQLTPEEQEFLCRTTRPVKYKKGERVHSMKRRHCSRWQKASLCWPTASL